MNFSSKWNTLLLVGFMQVFANFTYAQKRAFFGSVVNEKQEALPYAIIQSQTGAEGIYCNEFGKFHFWGNSDSIKKLVFNSIGYQTRELTINEIPKDSITVVLSPIEVKMPEILIVDTRRKKRSKKDRILGVQRANKHGGAFMTYGDEIAIFLNSDNRKSGTLKDVYVYITKEGISDSRFRLNVYGKDSNKNFPGFKLNKEDIVMSATKGDEWVKIDVSKEMIRIDNGIFLAIEWVLDYGNVDDTWTTTLPQYYISGSRNSRYNGQVLGMTYDYGVQSFTYWSKANNKEEWQYLVPMGLKKNTAIIVKHYINPMIYATYN